MVLLLYMENMDTERCNRKGSASEIKQVGWIFKFLAVSSNLALACIKQPIKKEKYLSFRRGRFIFLDPELKENNSKISRSTLKSKKINKILRMKPSSMIHMYAYIHND